MTQADRFTPPPDWQQGYFANAQGKLIRYGHVAAQVGTLEDIRGTVIITTGYADFTEAYYDTIRQYAKRGYAVWIMDWEGHGGSGRRRPDEETVRELIHHKRDLHQFYHEIVKPRGDKPVVLSTHSMGGQIALQYLRKHPDDFSYAIMGAPLVSLNVGGVVQGVLHAAFRLAVELGYGNKTLSGGRKHILREIVKERQQLLRKNPDYAELHRNWALRHRRLVAEDPTVLMIESMLRSTRESGKESFLKDIKTPVLIGMAAEDRIIDGKALARAAKLLPQAKLTLIEGAMHGLWIERENILRKWWEEIDKFMLEQNKVFDASLTARRNLRPPEPPAAGGF